MAPVSKRSCGKKENASKCVRKVKGGEKTVKAEAAHERLVLAACKGAVDGTDPIVKACTSGNLELVRALINFTDYEALRKAGVPDGVIGNVRNKDLIELREDDDDQFFVLEETMRGGHLQLLQYFVGELGLDVNECNAYVHMSPMSIFHFLIEKGSNMIANPEFNTTVLDLAKMHKRMDLVEALETSN